MVASPRNQIQEGSRLRDPFEFFAAYVDLNLARNNHGCWGNTDFKD